MPLTFAGTEGIAPDAAFECGEGWRVLISQAAAEVAQLPEEWNTRIVGGKLDGWSPHIAIKAFCLPAYVPDRLRGLWPIWTTSLGR